MRLFIELQHRRIQRIGDCPLPIDRISTALYHRPLFGI